MRFVASAVGLIAVLLAPTAAQAAKPGQLDRSFGDGGSVKTHFADHSVASAVTIDGPGRTVAAGTAGFDFALTRHKSHGELDPSFAGSGMLTTGFAGGEGYVASSVRSVVLGVYGRIVAAGTKCNYEDPERFELLGCEFALARYKKDGTLDPAFGDGGTVTTGFADGIHRVPGGAFSAAMWDRRVVVAGGDGRDFALARYRRHGDLDPTFGTGGKVTTDFGGFDCAFSVAVDSDRRILVAGTSDFNRFAIARYKPDGTLDPSFGDDGKVLTRYRGTRAAAYSAVIRRSGRIVVAGGSDWRFALARYRPNGRLDHRFSDNGKVRTSFGDRPRDRATAKSVAIDSRRRIVAVGGDFKLARYMPDGRLDRSFGTRGKVASAVGNHLAPASSAAIDRRDRIVVAGGHANFLVARFVGYRRP